MKTYEKIITILITLSLFVCLYLTGQSVFRTAFRYTPQFLQNAGTHSAAASKSSTVKGICGNNLTWKFADGILTISGTGNMIDYKNSDAPWAALTITTVKIEEGVTSIGAHAFCRNKSLKLVLIPSTLTSIKTDVFNYNEKPPGIYTAYDSSYSYILYFLLYLQAIHQHCI